MLAIHVATGNHVLQVARLMANRGAASVEGPLLPPDVAIDVGWSDMLSVKLLFALLKLQMSTLVAPESTNTF